MLQSFVSKVILFEEFGVIFKGLADCLDLRASAGCVRDDGDRAGVDRCHKGDSGEGAVDSGVAGEVEEMEGSTAKVGLNGGSIGVQVLVHFSNGLIIGFTNDGGEDLVWKTIDNLVADGGHSGRGAGLEVEPIAGLEVVTTDNATIEHVSSVY